MNFNREPSTSISSKTFQVGNQYIVQFRFNLWRDLYWFAIYIIYYISIKVHKQSNVFFSLMGTPNEYFDIFFEFERKKSFADVK